jgi:hypothetical protein
VIPAGAGWRALLLLGAALALAACGGPRGEPPAGAAPSLAGAGWIDVHAHLVPGVTRDFRGAVAAAVEWRRLFQDLPDRFVIGTDQFIAAPGAQGRGPGLAFAQHASLARRRARLLLDALPQDLRRAIGHDNAVRLYRLR